MANYRANSFGRKMIITCIDMAEQYAPTCRTILATRVNCPFGALTEIPEECASAVLVTSREGIFWCALSLVNDRSKTRSVFLKASCRVIVWIL